MEFSQQITNINDIVEYYKTINKERELYVGIEWERSGVYRDTLKPVLYEGDKGYLAVLKKLVSEVGWEIIDGHRNQIFELQRGNTRVTIEADGRLELAGSPQKNLHDLAREFRIHANEVEEMGNFLNIVWIPLGWQPFHSDKEIKMINKKRYKIFLDVIKDRRIESTMKRNNGLTANFSFTDEENIINKAKAGFRISPIIGAIFASSPFNECKIANYLDMRRFCIMEYAPERNSMPRNILDKSFSLKDWIDFYLKIPVILIKQEGKEDFIPKNLTFEKWIQNGYKGMKPTLYNFDQHIKTTWGDIRLRPSYIEYRVADSVPSKLVMSVPALIKGLLMDSGSWGAIEELTKDWSYDDIVQLDRKAWKEGLQTEIKGKKLLSYAQELITLANEKLHKFSRTSGADTETDESIFLAALKEQIYIKEKSPAEELAELWEKEWNHDPKHLLEWCEEK